MSRHRFFSARHLCAMLVFLVGACCLGSLSTAGAQERTPALTAGSSWTDQGVDFAKLFDAVVDTVEEKFLDAALLRQIDWQSRAKAARPSVLSAASPDDAVRQINALLSELKTSHTWLFTPDDYDYYAILDVVGATGPSAADLLSRRFWGSGPYYPGAGAFTREIDGRHFVDGILEGSPAERAGLKYGDEILTVDGVPYNPIAAGSARRSNSPSVAMLARTRSASRFQSSRSGRRRPSRRRPPPAPA
jgi:C-terminal processing protease CtpA/Prc